jgi:hypothetical protein
MKTKTKYQKHDVPGEVKRWYATRDDADRLRKLKAQCATAGLLKPSHAVLIRAGLLLLEQHVDKLAALASKVA